MPDISDMSDKDILAELERRQHPAQNPPEQRAVSLDAWVAIREAVKAYVKEVQDGHPEPEKQWIFETAMEAIYGGEIWDWLSKARK